jgi:hypothetical protein
VSACCVDCGVKPADRPGLVLLVMRGAKTPFWLCGRCWIKRGEL